METKLTNDIVSTIAEDEPLIYISIEAINLKRDNDKMKERIDNAIEYIKSRLSVPQYEIFGLNIIDILEGEDK